MIRDHGLSFLATPPRPGFAVRLVRLEPGEDRPYRADEWAGALVVIESGAIELETRRSRRIQFGHGSVLHLSGLGLISLRNRGPQPAVLSRVTRRSRGRDDDEAQGGRPRTGRVGTEERTMSDRVTGPASYFPSIRKKYGQPIEHWYAQLEQHRELTHMEMVRFLKSEHGMGHGHANAIVGEFRATRGR